MRAHQTRRIVQTHESGTYERAGPGWRRLSDFRRSPMVRRPPSPTIQLLGLVIGEMAFLVAPKGGEV